MTTPNKPQPGTEFPFVSGPLHGSTAALPLMHDGYPATAIPFDVTVPGPGGSHIRRRCYYRLMAEGGGGDGLYYAWMGPESLDDQVMAELDWDTALEEELK